MIHHFPIWLALCSVLRGLQVSEQLVVVLLLVLHVRLITHRCLQIHHVLTNDSLHLERIEMLLVVDHIAQGVLVILDLSELYIEHVCEFVKVLFHVVDRYTLLQLVVDGI